MFLISFISTVQAQETPQSLTVASGPFGSTSALMSEQLGRVIHGWSGIELRTMIGNGSTANIDDLQHLDDVDFAFINFDALINLSINNPDDPALEKMAYLTKIADANLHVLVRGDANIQTVQDLKNRRVSLGVIGSGASLTARLIMRFHQVQSDYAYMDTASGIAALKARRVDAVFVVDAKPAPFLSSLTQQDNLRLLPVPFSEKLAGVYNPSAIETDDYPNLVQGGSVEGISVPVILMGRIDVDAGDSEMNAYQKFSKAFIGSIPRLRGAPRHPKWKDIDLKFNVIGWQRFQPFVDVLKQRGME